MPKGLFGDKNKKGNGASSQDNALKGQQFIVRNHTVIVESKLAEGGFAIVYLVRCVRTNKRLALKRQFVNDSRQLEGCRREKTIIESLSEHPNIVTFVDASLVPVEDGVYEYLLLTQFYPRSVLALMNDRLMSGECLGVGEILAIFCDMCCAVARLHHSQTPVMHRDLKVENILATEQHEYVLCDFGSATTKVLSTATHSHSLVEEEVLKFTTLSYRAPEMIDLYQGKPMTTKCDIWAMGVMLYKLAYFSVPFGESALAIQNATFSMPSRPKYPPALKALIRYILEPDCLIRPDIFQVSYMAFQLAQRRCPVPNLSNSPVPKLQDLLSLLALHEQKTTQQSRASDSPKSQKSSVSTNEVLASTTVAPRQRPKPSAALKSPLWPSASTSPILDPQSSSSKNNQVVSSNKEQLGFHDLVVPQDSLGDKFGEAETCFMQREGETRPSKTFGHRRNVSDTGGVFAHTHRHSAFKPYVPCGSSEPDSLDVGNMRLSDNLSPGPRTHSASDVNPNLDNTSFGEEFDRLPRPRRDSISSTCNVKSSESLVMEVDETDPFGAAPFHPPSTTKHKIVKEPGAVAVVLKPATEGDPLSTLTSLASSIKHNRYRKFVDDDEAAIAAPSAVLSVPTNDSDSVGSATDLTMRMQASSDDSAADSDQDVVKAGINYTHLETYSSDSGTAQRDLDANSPSSDIKRDSGDEDLNQNSRRDGHEPLIADDELDLGSSLPLGTFFPPQPPMLKSPESVDTLKAVDLTPPPVIFPQPQLTIVHVDHVHSNDTLNCFGGVTSSMDMFGAVPLTRVVPQTLGRVSDRSCVVVVPQSTVSQVYCQGEYADSHSMLSDSADDSSTELHFSAAFKSKPSKKKTFTKSSRHESDGSNKVGAVNLNLSGSLGRKNKSKSKKCGVAPQEAAFVNTSFQAEDSESPPSPIRRHMAPNVQNTALHAGTM